VPLWQELANYRLTALCIKIHLLPNYSSHGNHSTGSVETDMTGRFYLIQTNIVVTWTTGHLDWSMVQRESQGAPCLTCMAVFADICTWLNGWCFYRLLWAPLLTRWALRNNSVVRDQNVAPPMLTWHGSCRMFHRSGIWLTWFARGHHNYSCMSLQLPKNGIMSDSAYWATMLGWYDKSSAGITGINMWALVFLPVAARTWWQFTPRSIAAFYDQIWQSSSYLEVAVHRKCQVVGMWLMALPTASVFVMTSLTMPCEWGHGQHVETCFPAPSE